MFDSGLVPSRLINPRQSIISDESSPETLENLIRVTQNQESILQTYYTDDNGDVVTLSVYDISHTDPTEIIGIEMTKDILDMIFIHDRLQGNDIMDRHEYDYEYDEENEDFDEAVARRLERLRRRNMTKSGDSLKSHPEESVTSI